jgi:hypothetical protein
VQSILFHGVLAPCAKLLAMVVPQALDDGARACCR